MRIDAQLLDRLRDRAIELDRSGDWPEEQFQWLATAGVLGAVIPRNFGGSFVSQLEMIQGYEALSAVCLTTAFILTQRNGACQRITACSNESLKRDLLPGLASGELFATVGISHLTTSRQHLQTPSVTAEIGDDGIRLNGLIPWVTGAAHAQYIVTGGTCPDGTQLLIALPTDVTGVTIQPHSRLMALTASHTASVELNNVVLPAKLILAGPIHDVMKQGQGGGTGSQVTSTLAVGVSARMIEFIRQQTQRRTELAVFAEHLSDELTQLQSDLYHSVSETPADHEALASVPLSAAEIRLRANSLVLRVTQSAMAISKGAGFVQGHLAELAVREAMFFLVWSCPPPVVEGVLQELTSRG